MTYFNLIPFTYLHPPPLPNLNSAPLLADGFYSRLSLFLMSVRDTACLMRVFAEAETCPVLTSTLHLSRQLFDCVAHSLSIFTVSVPLWYIAAVNASSLYKNKDYNCVPKPTCECFSYFHYVNKGNIQHCYNNQIRKLPNYRIIQKLTWYEVGKCTKNPAKIIRLCAPHFRNKIYTQKLFVPFFLYKKCTVFVYTL